MPRNPYLAAYRRQASNRRRTGGHLPALGRLALALVAVLLLVPLVRPVFLSFLDLGRSAVAGGLEGIAVRGGLLLVAVLSLDLYTAVIRSPDRAVLDLHPVDPAGVVAFEAVRVAEERAWLVAALALLLAPIGLEVSWLAWAGVLLVLLGAYAVGLAAATLMFLLAVDIAESPRWEAVLDLVRGTNQRAQAAFIWAPGVVLAGAGALVVAASWGLGRAWEGQPLPAAALLAPFAGAVLAWRPVRRLSPAWFRASAVLADVDARYAALEEREEGQRVYLDWVVRLLPAEVGRYVLKDLRHGWRARRTWVLGPWLVGIGAGLAAWSAAEAAPGTAAAVASAGVWLFAAVGVLMDRDDPDFLARWMPPEPGRRLAARALVLALWTQGCLWLAVLAALVRHGGEAALGVLLTGLLAWLVAVPAAAWLGRYRTWGAWLYGPTAAVAGAALLAWRMP